MEPPGPRSKLREKEAAEGTRDKKWHGDRREGKLWPEAHVPPGMTWPKMAGVLWFGNVNTDTYHRDSGSLRAGEALGVKF